jgi:hypothetical protein
MPRFEGHLLDACELLVVVLEPAVDAAREPGAEVHRDEQHLPVVAGGVPDLLERGVAVAEHRERF